MNAFKYSASATALAAPAGTADFVQLRGAATVSWEVLEVRVFQTADTTLALNGIRFSVGTTGATGTGLSERLWHADGPAALVTAVHTPGTSVTIATMELVCGWNILQEFVWLPTPETQLWLSPSDTLGLSLVNNDTLTMGVNVTWREYR